MSETQTGSNRYGGGHVRILGDARVVPQRAEPTRERAERLVGRGHCPTPAAATSADGGTANRLHVISGDDDYVPVTTHAAVGTGRSPTLYADGLVLFPHGEFFRDTSGE